MRRAHDRLSYPTAARGRVVEQYHGTAVADPYRWLEDLDSPATRAWVSAEARLTHTYLEALPQRARIRARIAALYDFEKNGIPFQEGGRYFYTNNSGHQIDACSRTACIRTGSSSRICPPMAAGSSCAPVKGRSGTRDARICT
jgi:prolyl oligopeptidase